MGLRFLLCKTSTERKKERKENKTELTQTHSKESATCERKTKMKTRTYSN